MIFGLIWNVVLLVLIVVDPHRSFDMKRCAPVDAAFVRQCWPKNGCFFTAPDAVLCWRVATVKPARGGHR